MTESLQNKKKIKKITNCPKRKREGTRNMFIFLLGLNPLFCFCMLIRAWTEWICRKSTLHNYHKRFQTKLNE